MTKILTGVDMSEIFDKDTGTYKVTVVNDPSCSIKDVIKKCTNNSWQKKYATIGFEFTGMKPLYHFCNRIVFFLQISKYMYKNGV